MKKMLFLLFLYFPTLRAQNVVNDQLSIGIVRHLNSLILGEKRTIWISLPTSYSQAQFAKSRYPVVYVLDGDANFATVSAMTKQLSIRNGNTEFPEMIVVGILNTDRERDFSPTKSVFQTYGKLAPDVKTGGGERFTAFMEKELMGYIDNNYPTAPYRILIGHSLGGLATANVLVNHTHLFNGYILIDPSMWWDNRSFLSDIKKTLAQSTFSNTGVYLGIANNLPADVDTSALRRDTAMSTFHTRSIFLFKDALLKNKQNGLRFSYRFYPTEPHMSAPLITIYDGLHYLLDFYTMPTGWVGDFFNPENRQNTAKLFTQHYNTVSTKMGYKVLPSESLINNYAGTALGSGMPEKALPLYELNVINYPGSYGAYESLGDFYEHQKDVKHAIASYRKSLALKATRQVRHKLHILLNK